MYTLDQHLVLGDPRSAYPLLSPSQLQLPQLDRSKHVAAKRAELWNGTNAQADFQAPGVRDHTSYPAYAPKYFRGHLYDAQRSANVPALTQYDNPNMKWAQTSDWFRNSQLEWEREFSYTRTYEAPNSLWVDHGQFNHFPMRVSPIASIPPVSTQPFI